MFFWGEIRIWPVIEKQGIIALKTLAGKVGFGSKSWEHRLTR
jgi:hypothetical protein